MEEEVNIKQKYKKEVPEVKVPFMHDCHCQCYRIRIIIIDALTCKQ